MWTIGACLCVAAVGWLVLAINRRQENRDGWSEDDAWMFACALAVIFLGIGFGLGARENRSDVPDPNAWSVVVGERDPEERAAGVAVRVRPRAATVTP